MIETFSSLTVIGETSVDYDKNVCFQTLKLSGEQTVWVNSMLEVAGYVSSQDCFLFCTIDQANVGFQEAFSRRLRELGLGDMHPLYHSKRGQINNVTFRLSDVGKLLRVEH